MLTFPYVTFYLSRTRTILLEKEDPSLPAEIFISKRGPGFFLHQYNNMEAIVYE